MKYATFKAFEKSLESAAPGHLSSIYVVMSKESFERKAACDKIASHALGGSVKIGQNYCLFDVDEVDMTVVWDELQAFSFLSPKKVVVILQADKLSKAWQERMRAYFIKPNKSVCLVLEAATLNRATNYYKEAEKCGTVLDIAEEKPWEKERALQGWVAEQLARDGKKIDGQTASALVRQLGTDLATLHQELEKLICYVGDRQDIKAADVSAVCTTISQENGWQLGEAIFRRDASEAMRIAKALLSDGTALIALIRQIRTQFQTDYQVCCLLANGKTPQDVALQFPYMKGQILSKHLQQAQAYGMEKFKLGILTIDATELMAKNSAGDPEWLAERLILKLTTQ